MHLPFLESIRLAEPVPSLHSWVVSNFLLLINVAAMNLSNVPLGLVS